MDRPIDVVEQLCHFSHRHPLSLVLLQQLNQKIENVDDEDEDEEKDDVVEEDHNVGQCNMCEEQITPLNLCYYHCTRCNYSLHKFCAELPETLQNHLLHPDHHLKIEMYIYYRSGRQCFICRCYFHDGQFIYKCVDCFYRVDIACVAMLEQKINHPSHPHQLERVLGHKNILGCVACGNKHEGVFFQCATCPWFPINLDCALLPFKLLIQNHTDGAFIHSHPLTLAYSFHFSDQRAKFHPKCRVCDRYFEYHLWIYKCDKCRYYVHVDCATSKREPFMSIFLTASTGKTYKNFKEEEHPNLLYCPFNDEADNLLKRHMSNQKKSIGKQHDGEMLNYHQHPLILFDKQISVGKETVSLHDPMKRIELLCDGCVKPITMVPFYTCCQYEDEQCLFVLHEWCAKLPLEVQDHMVHPDHPLSLLPKVPGKFFGVFECAICSLPSNGFAYGCTTCKFYVDVNCAFIPEEIIHDAHPDHLLLKAKPLTSKTCKACDRWSDRWGFLCSSCEFYIHVECALLLPKGIKNKCDKHPLSLRYEPAENHISEYFCEICEDEFDPWNWFYHCTKCSQSMHAACAPLILQVQCEQATYQNNFLGVYKFLNVKFGGTHEIEGHSHRLAFVQGLERDGKCIKCRYPLQYKMIFKCLEECEFAFHYKCASSFVDGFGEEEDEEDGPSCCIV